MGGLLPTVWQENWPPLHRPLRSATMSVIRIARIATLGAGCSVKGAAQPVQKASNPVDPS